MLKRSLNLVSLLQTLIYASFFFFFSVHTSPSTSSCKPGLKKNYSIIDKGRNNNNNNNNDDDDDDDDDDNNNNEDDSIDNYKIQTRYQEKSLALNRSFI